MKALILTNSENTLKWRSLTSKLKVIEGALNSGKNADFTVDIHAVSHTPMVVNHRIVHDWLNQLIAPFFKQGYDLLPFHMTMSQKKEFGIQASLRGANPRTDDEMGDMYFFANEYTKRNGFNQFIETCLHEIAHEYFAETGLPDITHEWHKKHGTIVGLFATLDWSLYQPNRMKLKLIKNLLVKVVELLTLKKNLTDSPIHPVEKYRELISQDYGAPNNGWYKLTGHHIGTDFACPIGTPVKAPMPGKVTTAGYSQSLGNYCHYEFTLKGQVYVARFLHFQNPPNLGQYRRGELLAKSGDSGRVSGPHLHIDIWKDEVRLDLVNKKNWKLFTVNPEEIF